MTPTEKELDEAIGRLGVAEARAIIREALGFRVRVPVAGERRAIIEALRKGQRFQRTQRSLTASGRKRQRHIQKATPAPQ